jgi:acetyltransferase-like isoleucine patch superfamily enzyme
MIVLLPWILKRPVLRLLYGYRFGRGARIGFSWVFPDSLAMAEGSSIGHLNVVVHLREVRLGENATIGRGNWITGHPAGASRHFRHLAGRNGSLIVGRESAITKSHHIDCTELVTIGAFSTIAGYRTQILTHSIDLEAGRQDAKPVEIGSYCFVGTAAVILGGARLPNRSVLGAMALLKDRPAEQLTLYAGVPARAAGAIPAEAAYFNRGRGFVD